MVCPPSYAIRVAIRNSSATHIAVEAVFGSDHQAADGKDFIRERVTVAPHDTVVLGEHEYNMGSWTAHAAVYAVHATHPRSNARASWSPQLSSGIVDVVTVELGADAHNVTLRQR